MSDNKKKPIANVFNSVYFYNQNQISEVIENIDLPQSIFFITQALQHAFSNGNFSLHESEIISKSLRILNNHLLNDDGIEAKN